MKFDGYEEVEANQVVFKDARGFGYEVNKDGTWRSTSVVSQRMRASLIKRAIRQEGAVQYFEQRSGKQALIEWLYAEEFYQNAFEEAIVEAKTSKITLKHVLPSPEVRALCKKKPSGSGSSSSSSH